jgi:hypothetical protein
MNSLKEGKSLKELIKEAKADSGIKKLEALKLTGARLLQEHHPEEKEVSWKDLPEAEKITVRLAERMVHAAEMEALNRRLNDENNPLNDEQIEVFERNYLRYAKSVDIPTEQRGEYTEMAQRLAEKLPKVAEAKKERLREREEKITARANEEVAQEQAPAEWVSVFDMDEEKVQEVTVIIQRSAEERRNSSDLDVRRGQELVDGDLWLPEEEGKALVEAKGKKKAHVEQNGLREERIEKINEVISGEVEAVCENAPDACKGLKKYADNWENEFGRDSAQNSNSLLDKVTTQWTEAAYVRVMVGTREQAMRDREEFVGVLRRVAVGEKVTGEMESELNALADRFELMNLQEREKDVEGSQEAEEVAGVMEQVAEEEETVKAEIVDEVEEKKDVEEENEIIDTKFLSDESDEVAEKPKRSEGGGAKVAPDEAKSKEGLLDSSVADTTVQDEGVEKVIEDDVIEAEKVAEKTVLKKESSDVDQKKQDLDKNREKAQQEGKVFKSLLKVYEGDKLKKEELEALREELVRLRDEWKAIVGTKTSNAEKKKLKEKILMIDKMTDGSVLGEEERVILRREIDERDKMRGLMLDVEEGAQDVDVEKEKEGVRGVKMKKIEVKEGLDEKEKPHVKKGAKLKPLRRKKKRK